MDAKQIYMSLYRRAREIRRIRQYEGAFFLIDDAVSDFFDDGNYDQGIDRVVAISNAVLWAMHWKHFAPTNLRLWQSERRISFELAEVGSGKESRTWFEPARLP